MGNFILTRILRAIGKRLDGYKTKIGGGGGILMGVSGLVRVIFPDLTQLPDIGLEVSLGLITGGFAVLGLGGKAEKLKTAIEKTQSVPALLESGGPTLLETTETAPDIYKKITEQSRSKGPACSPICSKEEED